MVNSEFSTFKKFVFSNPNEDIWDNKHVFFRIKDNEVAETEKRLEIKLPDELERFYNEIGYGFVCNGKSYNVNRIIAPSEIANFYLGIGTYQNDERRDFYNDKNMLIFFELSAQSFITMDLVNRNLQGQCPVYFEDDKIADSLSEFLRKMDKEVDYYMQEKE
jgi:hypothetical protein